MQSTHSRSRSVFIVWPQICYTSINPLLYTVDLISLSLEQIHTYVVKGGTEFIYSRLVAGTTDITGGGGGGGREDMPLMGRTMLCSPPIKWHLERVHLKMLKCLQTDKKGFCETNGSNMSMIMYDCITESPSQRVAELMLGRK